MVAQLCRCSPVGAARSAPMCSPSLAARPVAMRPSRCAQTTATARRMKTGAVAVDTVKTEATAQPFQNFDDMLSHFSALDKPVLVDFFSEWCGPCRVVSQQLENIAQELDGKVHIVKVDTKKYPGIARRFEVKALPTVIMFRKGEPVARTVGAKKESRLHSWIQTNAEVN